MAAYQNGDLRDDGACAVGFSLPPNVSPAIRKFHGNGSKCPYCRPHAQLVYRWCVTDDRQLISENLYTIILDFKGGTYISQVSHLSPIDAVCGWADTVSVEDAIAWRLDRSQLTTMVRRDNPIPITGCTSVWCVSGSIGEDLALINIVETVRRP